jgi:hypothetical protein
MQPSKTLAGVLYLFKPGTEASTDGMTKEERHYRSRSRGRVLHKGTMWRHPRAVQSRWQRTFRDLRSVKTDLSYGGCPRTHLINRNGCVARDMVLLQGARRENILYGSSTDEQRRGRAKDRATLQAEFWQAAGGVAPQSQSATAMLFRRASPAASQNSAHPVPIYEMGSKQLLWF